MRVRSAPISLACALVVTAAVGEARAGIAWGDASLHADEIRVEIDAAAHALVTHVVAVHVARKTFRAFALDGIDEHAEAPLDAETVAAMDGPGWPIAIVDDKGEPFSGFVEPAKEPRRLRVHLGQDGVPRGDYSITIRYRVDLSSNLRRDGARAFFGWRAPSWPEGYDNGKLVFVLPTAPTEPRVSLVDGSGGEPRTIEGAALLDLRRTTTLDELTLLRPHVPHHDDVEWVLSFDPKAMPEATAKLPTVDRGAAPIAPTRTPVRLDVVAAMSGALAVLGAIVVARRDRDAARVGAFRPLVPFADALRAAGFGAFVGASLVACSLGHSTIGAVSLVLALVVSTLRSPPPEVPASGVGRWLAMPASAVPTHARAPNAPLDPGGWLGAALLLLASAGIGAGCVATWRLHSDWSAMIAMHGLVMLWPFATGRASQAAPDLVCDAWSRLRPVARVIERAFSGRVRVVGHVPRNGGLDEVRLRIVPTEDARVAGVMDVEIGCAIVAGLGASSLVPELLVRIRKGSNAARAFERRLAAARASATFEIGDGKGSSERVVSIRPAIVSPNALRRWIDWIFQLAVKPVVDVVSEARVRTAA